MQAPAAPSSSSQSAQSTARRAVIGTASMSRAPCPSDGRCSASSRTGLLRASRSHRDPSTRFADAEVSTEIRVALDTGSAFMSRTLCTGHPIGYVQLTRNRAVIVWLTLTPNGLSIRLKAVSFWQCGGLGGHMDERILGQPISRRGLLKATGSIGLAGLAYPWLSAAKAISAATSGLSRTFPVDHIVVDMQENRSFDHYYGFAPFVPAPYKVPDGYSQPDGHGGSVVPYHFT